MRTVQEICILLLALLLLGACATDPEEIPVIFPDPEPPPETPVREPPKGFLGDPATHLFHRTDCPRAEAIDPARREFWASPYEGLDAGYAPCDWCAPLRGWK